MIVSHGPHDLRGNLSPRRKERTGRHRHSPVNGSLIAQCALLLLGHSLAPANTLDLEPKRNISNNLGASVLPRVTVNGPEIFVVWRDDSTGNREIFFARSDDSGRTFSPAFNLSDNPGDSSGLSGIPPQIATRGDSIHVVWADDTPGNFDIFYRRSTDGGETFDPVQNLSLNPLTSEEPQVAVVGANVHVVWQDVSPGNTDIFYRRSTNSGASFGPVQNLSANATFSVSPQIAIAATNVFVAWSDSLPGSADIYYRRSVDGGSTFEGIQNLSDNPGNSGLFYGSLRLLASGQNVHVAWEDDTPGSTDILYRRSTDSGMTFGSPQNLSSTVGDSGSPQMGSSGETVSIVWHDEFVPGAGRDILYRRSLDNGETFEPIINLAPFPEQSEIPAMTIDGSSVLITWDHHFPTPSEALLRRSGDSGATFEPVQNVSNNAGDSFGCQLATNGPSVFLFWSDLTSGNAEILFRRATPRPFLRFPVCDAGDFTAGVCTANVDPRVWPVTAILDHSGGYYSEVDGRVLPYSADLVCDSGDGATPECDGEVPLGSNGPPQSGYRLDCSGTPVDFGGRLAYVGVGEGDAGACSPNGNLQANAYLNYNGHSGYDFDTVNAEPFDVVLAASAGVLQYAAATPDPVLGGDPSRFNSLLIRHPNGLETWYLHSQPGSECALGGLCNPGESVSVAAGQAIALAGNTGLCPSGTGPCCGCSTISCPCAHLHFEIRATAKPEDVIDPFGCSPGIASADPVRCATPSLWLVIFADGFESGDLSGWLLSP